MKKRSYPCPCGGETELEPDFGEGSRMIIRRICKKCGRKTAWHDHVVQANAEWEEMGTESPLSRSRGSSPGVGARG